MSTYSVHYRPAVYKDAAKLQKAELLRIKISIEQKLTVSPQTYGLPLRGELSRYWKLRVGSYRVVYEILPDRVVILAIAHRKDVYSISPRRI
ncbi:MAG: type II toxin-antitoxin system RelE/ParE family toxin [Patescibacteria group bacterium]